MLFAATAAFVLWQNARVAVLWDLGYLLDTSWRIAAGQMPYRDFPLAHAPLTFLIQAALIRIGGRHYFLHVAYVAVAGGLATVLTWRILLRLLRPSAVFARWNWLAALALAAPLVVVGIYSVYPHPIYDCDCTLAILIVILLLVRLKHAGFVSGHDFSRAALGQKRKRALAPAVAPLAAGATSVLPLFFKQNIGLPFLAVIVTGMLVLLATDLVQTRSLRAALRSQPAFVLAGIIIALLTGAAAIAATAGLANYIHWTVQFAAQRRLPGLASMLSVYQQPSFIWTLPVLAACLIVCHTRLISRLWARILALCLVAAPFAGSLIFLLIDNDADERADNLLALWPLLLLAAFVVALFELRRGLTLRRLLPFFLLAAIHGTLLSQQLWGSTYALWPLLMVLVGCLLTALPPAARSVAIGSAAVIATAFLVCGAFYSISFERLRYIQIPDDPVQRSSIPTLRGVATPGPFLSNFDELVRFTDEQIPPIDAVLPLPGEDPFFYATGRTPQFPVTLFDPATDPYTADQVAEEARRRNIRWIIVKRALQINEDPMPDKDRIVDWVQRDFLLDRHLQGYDVYRRP